MGWRLRDRFGCAGTTRTCATATGSASVSDMRYLDCALGGMSGSMQSAVRYVRRTAQNSQVTGF